MEFLLNDQWILMFVNSSKEQGYEALYSAAAIAARALNLIWSDLLSFQSNSEMNCIQ